MDLVGWRNWSMDLVAREYWSMGYQCKRRHEWWHSEEGEALGWILVASGVQGWNSGEGDASGDEGISAASSVQGGNLGSRAWGNLSGQRCVGMKPSIRGNLGGQQHVRRKLELRGESRWLVECWEETQARGGNLDDHLSTQGGRKHGNRWPSRGKHDG